MSALVHTCPRLSAKRPQTDLVGGHPVDIWFTVRTLEWSKKLSGDYLPWKSYVFTKNLPPHIEVR